MEREEGMEILRNGGWLSATPVDFQQAILSRCAWSWVEARGQIQLGGEEEGELIGLARGIVEMRTILGRADTPLMHLAHPVFWFGYAPLFIGRARRIAVSAKTHVWLARIPQADLTALLAACPRWWQWVAQLSIVYGDVSQRVAADLLIRDSERRCAAVLLRLSGRRFAGPDDGAPIQVALTQSELAGAANLSRNSVGAIVKKLKARGLIDLGYGGFTIRASSSLRALLDER